MIRKIVTGWLFIFVVILSAGEIPNYKNVTRLYLATFDRIPDLAGLNYWVYDSGLMLEQVAQSFFDQPETKEKYPSGTTIGEFVNTVYYNLFYREPDEAGFNYWVDELYYGRVQPSEFILAVINGAQGSDKDLLEDRTNNALKELNLCEYTDDNCGETQSYSQEILDALNAHNKIRAEVFSGHQLVWSDELADSAQEYANELAQSGEFRHSGWGYGENLYASSWSSTLSDAVWSWYKEKDYYDYATNSCADGKQCGHYTQIVWQDTTEVGCGKAVYQTGNYKGWTVTVCQYNPPGNYIGEWPY